MLLTVPPLHRDVMHLSIHLFGKKRISSQDRLGKVLGLGAEHCGLAGLGLSAAAKKPLSLSTIRIYQIKYIYLSVKLFISNISKLSTISSARLFQNIRPACYFISLPFCFSSRHLATLSPSPFDYVAKRKL